MRSSCLAVILLDAVVPVADDDAVVAFLKRQRGDRVVEAVPPECP